jgi:hypothetical protein
MIYAECFVMTVKALLGILGGLLVGLGVGGGAAAVIESVTSGASTVPIVISGMAFGLGIGLIVACLAPVGSTQKARLGQVDLTELARLVRGENTLQP